MLSRELIMFEEFSDRQSQADKQHFMLLNFFHSLFQVLFLLYFVATCYVEAAPEPAPSPLFFDLFKKCDCRKGPSINNVASF